MRVRFAPDIVVQVGGDACPHGGDFEEARHARPIEPVGEAEIRRAATVLNHQRSQIGGRIVNENPAPAAHGPPASAVRARNR